MSAAIGTTILKEPQDAFPFLDGQSVSQSGNFGTAGLALQFQISKVLLHPRLIAGFHPFGIALAVGGCTLPRILSVTFRISSYGLPLPPIESCFVGLVVRAAFFQFCWSIGLIVLGLIGMGANTAPNSKAVFSSPVPIEVFCRLDSPTVTAEFLSQLPRCLLA